MIKNWRNSIAIVIVLLFGFALLFSGTDGFTAFTAETARTNKLIEEKPRFPKVTLEDSQGRVYPITEFEGKYVMITFIYTACTDVCMQLEVNLSEVYHQVPEKYIGEEIIFLSISFDPTRDTPEVLDKYRDYFASDGETWRMARITDEIELDHLLDEFGVIVIPDGNGNFAHNSAFYLVDPTGELIDVMDFTEINEAAAKITSIIDKEVGG